MKKIAYLCVPYSHASEHVRESRAIEADKAAARLIEQGYVVFSPISHSHRIAHHMDNHNDGKFWIEQDLPFLALAETVFILKLDGWDKSRGIELEVQEAEKMGKTITYLEAN